MNRELFALLALPEAVKLWGLLNSQIESLILHKFNFNSSFLQISLRPRREGPSVDESHLECAHIEQKGRSELIFDLPSFDCGL